MWTFNKVEEFSKAYGFKPKQATPEYKSLHELLHPDENLIAIVEGTLKAIQGRQIAGNGVVIATNKRVIFYRKSLIGTVTKEEISLNHISSASFRKGILNASIIITSSSNVAEVDYCDKVLGNKFVNDLLNAMHNKQATANTIATPPASDNMEKLEKLFALKEKGVLTEDEFQSEKKKLLNS